MCTQASTTTNKPYEKGGPWRILLPTTRKLDHSRWPLTSGARREMHHGCWRHLSVLRYGFPLRSSERERRILTRRSTREFGLRRGRRYARIRPCPVFITPCGGRNLGALRLTK